MFQGLVDLLVFLFLSVYYIVESLIICCIPRQYRAGWKKNLRGEIALVTGGGNGIGRILCTKMSRLGATVVIWDINSQGADDTAAMLRQEGGKAFSYKCDISNCDDVYATAKKVRTEVGKVTILVNNAGIVSGKRLLDIPDQMIKKTFDVNILAHFWTTKAFLPDMIEADNGHIVTVASLAGLVGVNKLVDYSASKFAAVGFDESLRLELEVEGRRGVGTTVVCPYYVSTGMFEGVKSRLFPILEPDYVAEEIVTAIRSKDKVLLIPSYLRIFLALKFILPMKMLFELGSRILHVTTSLDHFQGRQPPLSRLNKQKHLVPWDCALVFLRCLIADTMQQFGYNDKSSPSMPVVSNGKAAVEPSAVKPKEQEEAKETTTAEQLSHLNGNLAFRRLNSELAANNGRLI